MRPVPKRHADITRSTTAASETGSQPPVSNLLVLGRKKARSRASSATPTAIAAERDHRRSMIWAATNRIVVVIIAVATASP